MSKDKYNFIQKNIENLNKIEIVILYCPNKNLEYIDIKNYYIYNNYLDKETYSKILLDTINYNLFDKSYNDKHNYHILHNLSFSVKNNIDDLIYYTDTRIDSSLNLITSIQNIDYSNNIFNSIIIIIDDFDKKNHYTKFFKTNKTKKLKLKS